jgi:hypothetical protein
MVSVGRKGCVESFISLLTQQYAFILGLASLEAQQLDLPTKTTFSTFPIGNTQWQFYVPLDPLGNQKSHEPSSRARLARLAHGGMNAALGPGALGTGSDSFVKRGPRFNKVPIWLVVLTILQNISQWEGLYILYIMENKKCSKPPTSHLKKANIKWKVPFEKFEIRKVREKNIKTKHLPIQERFWNLFGTDQICLSPAW